MKTLITVIILGWTNAFGASSGTLELKISNLKSTEGHVYVQLFSDKEEFLKEPYRKMMVDHIEGQTVTFIIDNLPEGNYAISVMHDENMNGDLDTGAFGIPQEGYGFSNNAKGMFGPPSYKESEFNFSEDKTMTIKLIHPPF